MILLFRSTKLFLWFFIVTAVLFPATSLHAQLTRGGISGTVRDASGAIIPGADVTITNLNTNQKFNVTTDGNGFYRVTALEPGPYSVLVKMTGFDSVENRAIVVTTTQEVTFNADLKVAGAAGVVVDVSGTATAVELNKTSPTISLTASSRQAIELPLSTDRDVNKLALLAPNVFTAPGSTQISANGQRARNNNFTIDGSDNNDIGVTLSTIPIIPEGVAEFQVQTNAYSAEFGRNSGAQINIITRSGTNNLHGDAWEYYRGSALDALTNVEKRNGRTRPPRFNENRFGFDLGGPVFRDKTFFFGLLEGDRTRSARLGTTVRIPTPAGFAALGSVPLGGSPFRSTPQSAQSRQAVLDQIAFLRNVYSQNPIFSNIINTPVNGVPIETGNMNLPIPSPDNTWYFQGRIDHQIGPVDNFTGRYAYSKPFSVNAISNREFGSLFSGNQDILDQNLALSEIHSFSSRVLNEFRFSAIRRNLQFPENDPRTPTATIRGNFFTIGGAANFPQGRVQNSFQWSDTLNWQAGRHAWKFGADIRRIRLFNLAAFDSKGTFNFNNFQDYMNNAVSSFTQALQTATFDARQTQQFYFVQDDIHLTPNFTLNLGLRYELSGVPFGFFGATDPQVQATLVPGPVEKAKHNFGPTFGFAYSPRFTGGVLGKLFGDGKSVVRGGYAIKYDILFYNILTVNASNYPRVNSIDKQNVFDQYPNLLPPVSGPPQFNPLAGFVNTPSDARNPSTQLYSFSIQREMVRDFVVEFGYTGSLARHGINQGQLNPAILTPDQIQTVLRTEDPFQIPSVQQRRVFPQFGSRLLISTTANAVYNAAFVSVNKRLSRGLQFGASYTFSKNISDNDESLGVASIATGSPQIPQDFFNVRAEKSKSAFDRTQRFVINYLYEIPWFKSGWASNAVVRNIFGGWQLSGITAFQSGQPFTILTGVDTNGNGAAGDRPNFNPNGRLTPDPVTGNLRTFDTSDMFLAPRDRNGRILQNGLGNGNLGKNTLRGPGLSNFDLSFSKRFRIREGHALTFRSDFFNAFNHPGGAGVTTNSYGNPVNNMNSPDFGKNLNTWGRRSITLGARYTF